MRGPHDKAFTANAGGGQVEEAKVSHIREIDPGNLQGGVDADDLFFQLLLVLERGFDGNGGLEGELDLQHDAGEGLD